jgi:hypothetical protein
VAKNSITPLPIAVRVYPRPPAAEKKQSQTQKHWRRPDAMFVFDTETRIDATQSLIFVGYQYHVKGECLEEGLFYADDLSALELAVVRKYPSEHKASSRCSKLLLLTKSEFLKKLYTAVYKGRCLLVGFNLSFDLARIAFDVAPARGRFTGGFSLGLWSYTDEEGRERRHPYRPRIAIKQIDSKRALRSFTSRQEPDTVDLIPDDSENGQPVKGYTFRGNFLDLRTLAYALTDSGYTLESACEAFGVEHGKIKATTHGIVTEEYIDYNRRDVQATSELAYKLLEEYDRHPITLQVTKALSHAAIGKAYLRAMGIRPILERQPGFPKHLIGYSQTAFFGGRTSAHIRKFPVPVIYTDFLSTYPTINSLMNLWSFVIAKEIRYVEHCTAEITDFLRSVTTANLFMPETWKKLTAFVKIIPNGDILPCRAKYNIESNDWQVGVNHLHAREHNGGKDALWFSLPDVVASVILTGRIPEIMDAFRLEAFGIQPGLKPVRLLGKVTIDPAREDFFKAAVEQRKGLSKRTDLSADEKDRLDKGLKVRANSASYGIYAEMNVQESEERMLVTCHSIDPEPYTCKVAHPEVPGEYCFPPMASLITGAARLMLALLEQSVTELGGTYAMEDTDSMAIVATEQGGIIPCPDGPLRTADGREAIKALSRKQVEGLADRFSSLKPYDPAAVPGSILKIEDVNFDPETKEPVQVWCHAISAKRYSLFLKDQNGEPVLLRQGSNSSSNGWKEHGLGHLLNPSAPGSEDRDWIAQFWLYIIRRSLGLPSSELPFVRVPSVGRVTVSSPWIMKSLSDFNAGKRYKDQIKPFGFLLTAHIAPFGHPAGVDPNRFPLIAPYETDPKKWLQCSWVDQYTGKHYRITTDGHTGSRTTARVKTYADVLRDYEYHPESKCADACGNVCGKQTIGLLYRRHVEMERVVYIGKESNRLEEVDSGMIQDENEVYTEYPDLRRDEWETRIRPTLNKVPWSWIRANSSFPGRSLTEWRAGRRRPDLQTQTLLKKTLETYTEPVCDADPNQIFNSIAHLVALFQ